ncbi:MAG: ATPase, partial [Gemmatimonadetes bacterium]|nr:ATPase [Gemmatimonadota bacterium]
MSTPTRRPELEITLRLAKMDAARRGHGLAGLEHLLFALLHEDPAVAVLRGAGADVDRLRGRVDRWLDEEEASPPADGDEADEVEAAPTLAFRRVVREAVLQVIRSGRGEVGGPHVLAALWDEADSFAVHFLEEAGVTRVAVLREISHGGAADGAARTGGARV